MVLGCLADQRLLVRCVARFATTPAADARRVIAECAKRFKRWHDAVNERHLELGCRGMPAFQLHLRYFRCARRPV
jgi:hypothetical protein